jgi:hypothetical protein
MATGTTHPIPIPGETWQPARTIDYEKFVTEDDKPVDNLYSERQHGLLTATLIDSWPGPGEGRPFYVCTDVGLFYSDNEPPFAPDVLLSLDVAPPSGDMSLKENRSYYMWKFNKPPDALVEVVSNNEGGELTTKLKGYARLRATYYIVWDPFLFLGDKPLYCFALQEGKYKPCEPWFPELGLGVKTWEGSYGGMPATFLRWCGRNGRLIPTGGERADEEKQRADEEKQRADEEKQRADEEKQRADQLAEKLRAAGIDPDKP